MQILKVTILKKNKEGDAILEFEMAYDRIVSSTCFKKDSYLITFKSGHNIGQIDLFVTRKIDQVLCKKVTS